jgi:hypothetical protein
MTLSKKAQKLIREIHSIVISDANQTIDFCTHALGFASTWHKADLCQRHAILKEIFDAVYVDTHTKQIVGVKPYIEFVPMFRQTQLVETEGRFVLKNEEAALDGQLPVWDGRDGIRIFARREVGYRPRPSKCSAEMWYLTNCEKRHTLTLSDTLLTHCLTSLPKASDLFHYFDFVGPSRDDVIAPSIRISTSN